jgi:hypothetical protein
MLHYMHLSLLVIDNLHLGDVGSYHEQFLTALNFQQRLKDIIWNTLYIGKEEEIAIALVLYERARETE